VHGPGQRLGGQLGRRRLDQSRQRRVVDDQLRLRIVEKGLAFVIEQPRVEQDRHDPDP